MESDNEWKNTQLNTEIVESAELDLMDLPPEMLAHVTTFLSTNKSKKFALVNERCNDVHRLTLNWRLTKCVDLRKFFHLNEEKVLDRVRNLKYKRVNLNQCYYLSPSFITELVSKDCVRELDLIECNCTPDVIRAVVELSLTSLTISLSKSWREFSVSKENKSVGVLNGLKNLEIYHRYRSKLLMSHVAQYVLPHCRRLQSLKLFTPKRLLIKKKEIDQVFQVSVNIPTPVPDLQSLVFEFHNYDNHLGHVKTFFEVVLYKKIVPITYIDLGNATVTALLSETLHHKNLILFENTDILRLDNHSVTNPEEPERIKLDMESVIKSMPKCTRYKKICVENVYIPDVSNLADILVKSGNTSLQEINLYCCEVKADICYFIKTISDLSPGITYLNICLVEWPRTLNRSREHNNSDLMNSLANLTNLRTLCILPAMLSQYTRKDIDMLKSSFYRVTKMLKSLRNLRIVGIVFAAYVKQDVLSYIKFFKNLKELYLNNFRTDGTEHCVLPEITRHCSKLKRLRITAVYNETRLDKMLLHAKCIKHLYLSNPTFKLTIPFVDSLSQCTQLEKLYVRLSQDEDAQILRYFARSLKNLKKLQFFSTRNLDLLLKEDFLAVYNEIKEKRPNVVFDNRVDTKLPVAHHAFFLT